MYLRMQLILLAAAAALLLYGCNGESISLEEALLAGSGTHSTEYFDAKDTEENRTSEYLAVLGTDGTEDKDKDSIEEGSLLYVYVCGAVHKPGVYGLEPGSRIVAAIEAAGGFLPEAATEAVNLAQPVADGIQITVPDISEQNAVIREESRKASGMVNLNTATEEELCSLSGIGAVRAQAILAYRREIGSFHDIEQLKEISGIGDSLFNQVKDNIYIE